MSNVLVEKNKLDLLANAIAGKSGEPLKLTLDEMVEAVDGIEIGGGGITPTGNINITQAGVTDVTNYATATVNEISPLKAEVDIQRSYGTQGGQRKWEVTPYFQNTGDDGAMVSGYAVYRGNTTTFNAIPTGTTITPTTSSQTIGGANYMMEGAVTVSAMPSGTAGTPTATKGTVSNHSVSVTPSVTNTTGYITGGTKSGTAVSVSASELVSGTLNVTSSGTKDVTNYASASIPSGTEGTPTATKGTVNNHSVSVTPSVINTNGFISGGTKTGTAVTVSASELVSGSETKTENGTYDVTNLAEIVVDVQGGGSSVQVESVWASSVSSSSLVFSNLKGNPTSFAICIDGGSLTPSATAKTDVIVFDGTSLHGQTIVSGTNAVVYDDTSYSKSYSNGTLTITSTGTDFDTDNGYIVAYSYGGSASNIGTKDVQVGSGATSITFTGLTHEPLYWSCIFKSNFGTSSGYQRVIFMQKVGSIVYGHCMDSATRESSSYWTASYSGGNLTITSQGTNQGGYFHQPGYYQLTYAIDESAPSYQTKTVTPTTSQQVVTADSGYDALSQVTVNAMPSMTLPSSTSATSSGTSKATISASSSTQYLNIPTGYNATAQYYTISASGGGGGANIATETTTNSSNQNTSISFTLPSGRTPKAFFARLTSQIARNSNSRYYYVFDMRWDGSSNGGVAGNTFYMYSGTLTNVTSGYSYSQSGTTFTLSSTGSRSASPGSFYNGTYELVYIY